MLSDFKPLLKNPRFVFLWISQLLSQLTINTVNFLLLLVLFEKTQSAIASSFLWIAYGLPAIIIGPLAAAAVDMGDRKKMLTWSNLLQSLVLLGYAFSQSLSIFLVYGVAVMYSTLNQFYVPAEFASLSTIVKKKDYPHANGFFFLTQQVSLIIGFSVAGLLNSSIGFTNTLFLCSGLLFLAFLSASRLPKMKSQKKVPKKFDELIVVFFRKISEGYNFLKSDSRVYTSFLLLMGLQVATAMLVVSVPIMARDIFKTPLNLSGVLIIAPIGIGTMFGSISIPWLLKRGWRKSSSIKFSALLSMISFLSLGLLTPNLSSTLRIALGGISVAILGTGFVGIFIPLQTLLQEYTPGGLRGRVFGNFWFLVTVATIFPVILSGTISEIFGIRSLMVLFGSVALITYFTFRKYERMF